MRREILSVLPVAGALVSGCQRHEPEPHIAACLARFENVDASRAAQSDFARGEQRLFKRVDNGVVPQIYVDGVNGRACPTGVDVSYRDDVATRWLSEAGFQEGEDVGGDARRCQRAAQTYAEKYNIAMLKLRPDLFAKVCPPKSLTHPPATP